MTFYGQIILQRFQAVEGCIKINPSFVIVEILWKCSQVSVIVLVLALPDELFYFIAFVCILSLNFLFSFGSLSFLIENYFDLLSQCFNFSNGMLISNTLRYIVHPYSSLKFHRQVLFVNADQMFILLNLIIQSSVALVSSHKIFLQDCRRSTSENVVFYVDQSNVYYFRLHEGIMLFDKNLVSQCYLCYLYQLEFYVIKGTKLHIKHLYQLEIHRPNKISILNFLYHLIINNKINIQMQKTHYNEVIKQTRPQSANLYVKQYRIPKQAVYNDVRNSVCRTFYRRTNLTKESKQIKQLINPFKISNQNNKKLDKLLIKYSVSVDHSRKKLSSVDQNVNVQFIVDKYIKSRSKSKQKQQSAKKMRIDLNKFYNKNKETSIIEDQQFFCIKSSRLKDIEERQKKRTLHNRSAFRNTSRSKKQAEIQKHPYMAIYNETQQQTLQLLNAGSSLAMPNQPISLPQPEEWEKNHRKLNNLYKGINTMRTVLSARSRSKKPVKQDKTFYIS